MDAWELANRHLSEDEFMLRCNSAEMASDTINIVLPTKDGVITKVEADNAAFEFLLFNRSSEMHRRIFSHTP